MGTRKSKTHSTTLRSKKQIANSSSFDQLQQQFEQWRANKSSNAPVPLALRQATVRAFNNGIPFSKLKSLRINHSQLKRWREQKAVSSKTTPHFVTVKPIKNKAPQTNIAIQTAACELTIHYPHGLHVAIRLADVTSTAQLLKTLC